MAPTLVFVAGPNGAGKTTAAPRLLRDEFGLLEFVNADAIASGLSGFNPDGAAIQAGRILLDRVHNLARQSASFAVETTLSGRSYARWIGTLRQRGYRIGILFLSLPSALAAVQRVSLRVQLGGHGIPEEVVHRRFQAGLSNFFNLYRPLCHRWTFYDNSSQYPREIARGNGDLLRVLDQTRWQSMLDRWQKKNPIS